MTESQNESIINADNAISRVSVKLPPFWRLNPAVWFKQLESQFALAGITEELTKFHHVVSALQNEELTVVTDLIINPPATKQYEALKLRLCTQYADSENQRFKDLISGMQLGDKKPSRLLLEMRGKASSHIGDELLKTLFLQRLPAHVQQILAISSDSLEKLAEMADGIMAVTDTAPTVQAVTNCDFTNLKNMIEEMSSRLAKLEVRSRSRSKSPFRRQRSRSTSQDDKHAQCWYHWRFKEKANKCIKPCNFSPEN